MLFIHYARSRMAGYQQRTSEVLGEARKHVEALAEVLETTDEDGDSTNGRAKPKKVFTGISKILAGLSPAWATFCWASAPSPRPDPAPFTSSSVRVGWRSQPLARGSATCAENRARGLAQQTFEKPADAARHLKGR